MEKHLIDNVSPIPTSSGSVMSGGDSPEQRISELSTALKVVKDKFNFYRRNLRRQIFFWSLACILIIIGCYMYGSHLLKEVFPDSWTWQVAYVSVIRITIAGAVFSLATFCFKILKSYIHLNEHNSHCITVIDSMANLVGAAKDEVQRNLIYGKLIDIIINFGAADFSRNTEDFKNLTTSGIEAICKAISKKD